MLCTRPGGKVVAARVGERSRICLPDTTFNAGRSRANGSAHPTVPEVLRQCANSIVRYDAACSTKRMNHLSACATDGSG